MGKGRKSYDDDDGRVIANMNIDGMPWYAQDAKKRREENFRKAESASDFSDLSRKETWEIIKGATKAGLLIAGVFILGMLVFILFCLFVWFR